MQMPDSTDGMFCFINCIPLSEVKLYLSNFREIVTKISIWFSSDATINLVRTNTDICLFLYKEKHDYVVVYNHVFSYTLSTSCARFWTLKEQKVPQLNKFISDSGSLIKYDKQQWLVYILNDFLLTNSLCSKRVDRASSQETLIIMFH